MESVLVLSIFLHKTIVFSKKIKVLYFKFTLLSHAFDLQRKIPWRNVPLPLNTILDEKFKLNDFNLVL